MSQGKSPLVWIIAGEASGDLYGAQLARDIREKDPSSSIAGMGGVKMREAGVDILVDSSELGVIGVVEVLGMLFRFISIMRFLVRKAKEDRPDVVVLIDYPGFNIRLARRLSKAGIKVLWYISPQVWAWRKSNISKLARYCRKLICIFPFEVDVYEGSGLEVEFVGHPLLEVVEKRRDESITRDKNLFLLLPGSRRSETKRLLYPMLEAAELLHEKHPEMRFVISTPREKVLSDVEKDLAEYRKKHPSFDLPLAVECGKTAFYMQKC
ncbi:MAG: lipid-A-disaccharide synthase, partial [Lentisphaeria bacterium]|nr:lipid-A-disaccharide synthase [Lentisphaeria bacterium]